MLITLSEAARLSGGVLHPDSDGALVLRYVCADSREALKTEGPLFAAIRGERTDGGLYVGSVLDVGGAALVSDRALFVRNTILVDDVRQSAGAFGRRIPARTAEEREMRLHHRQRRKNDHQGYDGARAGRQSSHLCDGWEYEQPDRPAAVGAAHPRGRARLRAGNRDERAWRDRAAVRGRRARHRRRDQHRLLAYSGFRQPRGHLSGENVHRQRPASGRNAHPQRRRTAADGRRRARAASLHIHVGRGTARAVSRRVGRRDRPA